MGSDKREQSFTIHEDVLISTSKFFRAACSKVCQEGKEKIVHLPGVKPNVFQVYAVWVYSGKMAINKDGSPDNKPQTMLVLDIWILGDVLDDDLFRNQAMKLCIEKFAAWNMLPSVKEVKHVWESTTPSSQLRKMLVDIMVARSKRADFAEFVNHYPRDFVETIAVLLMHQKPFLQWTEFAENAHKYLEPEANGPSASQ